MRSYDKAPPPHLPPPLPSVVSLSQSSYGRRGRRGRGRSQIKRLPESLVLYKSFILYSLCIKVSTMYSTKPVFVNA